MMCYDCVNCDKSANHGGKCERWEYNCPFAVFEKLSNNDFDKVKEVLELLKKAKDIAEVLKGNGDYISPLHTLCESIERFEDDVDEDLRKEWLTIQ